jgi:hypothetical protein
MVVALVSCRNGPMPWMSANIQVPFLYSLISMALTTNLAVPAFSEIKKLYFTGALESSSYCRVGLLLFIFNLKKK